MFKYARMWRLGFEFTALVISKHFHTPVLAYVQSRGTPAMQDYVSAKQRLLMQFPVINYTYDCPDRCRFCLILVAWVCARVCSLRSLVRVYKCARYIQDAEEWEDATATAAREAMSEWSLLCKASEQDCPHGCACLHKKDSSSEDLRRQ